MLWLPAPVNGTLTNLQSTAPVILVFFSLQRYFIRGIVMSGIKG